MRKWKRGSGAVALACLLLSPIPPAAAIGDDDEGWAPAQPSGRAHSYVQAGIGVTNFHRTLDPEPEDVDYSRAVGAAINISWQSADGWFIEGGYFGGDGCTERCLGSEETEGSHVGFERRAFGVGVAHPLPDRVSLIATTGRETTTIEACGAAPENGEATCRETTYRGRTAGLGARVPLGGRWRLQILYQRHFHVTRSREPLLTLGDSRLTATAIASRPDAPVAGYLQYLHERNPSARAGVRLNF